MALSCDLGTSGKEISNDSIYISVLEIDKLCTFTKLQPLSAVIISLVANDRKARSGPLNRHHVTQPI